MKTNEKKLQTLDLAQLAAVTGGVVTQKPLVLPNGSVVTTGGNPYGKFISFGP
jgi:hypothetical protein